MLFTAIYTFTRFAINSSLLACVCTLHLVDHLLEALSGFLTNPISSKKPWLTTIKHQFFNLLFYANSFFWFASTVSWKNINLKEKKPDILSIFANYSKLTFNRLYFQIRKYSFRQFNFNRILKVYSHVFYSYKVSQFSTKYFIGHECYMKIELHLLV